MSLINDALKRAKQAHEKKGQPLMQGAPLHTTPAKPARTIFGPVMISGAVILLVLIAGIFFLVSRTHPGKSFSKDTVADQTAQETLPARVNAPRTVSSPETSKPAATPKMQRIASPTNPQDVPPTIPSLRTAPKPDPAHPFPDVRLQGILYQPGRPAAIINGRTLFVGGRVADVTVIAITPESATVTWRGLTNVLILPQ